MDRKPPLRAQKGPYFGPPHQNMSVSLVRPPHFCVFGGSIGTKMCEQNHNTTLTGSKKVLILDPSHQKPPHFCSLGLIPPGRILAKIRLNRRFDPPLAGRLEKRPKIRRQNRKMPKKAYFFSLLDPKIPKTPLNIGILDPPFFRIFSLVGSFWRANRH